MPLKVQKGSRGIAPLLLNVGARWKCVVSIASLPLYPWEWECVPIVQVTGDRCGGEKISLPLPGFEPRTLLHKRVAIRLRYTGWSKSLCAPDDYNTECYKLCSKCPPPGSRLTLTPSVIPNSNYVIMVSDWNCLKYFCVVFVLWSSGAQRLFDRPV
jgi:hypothetical protein